MGRAEKSGITSVSSAGYLPCTLPSACVKVYEVKGNGGSGSKCSILGTPVSWVETHFQFFISVVSVGWLSEAVGNAQKEANLRGNVVSYGPVY